MRIKLDENLPFRLARVLATLGHETDTVPQEGLAERFAFAPPRSRAIRTTARNAMKVQYNREDDVLPIHLSDGAIDHAEETDGIIVHFSPDDHPVLLEVLEASDFLSRLTKITATAEPGRVVSI